MSTNDKNRKSREKAEARLNKAFPELNKELSAEEVRELLHKLRTYQIELEIQNEELLQTQHQLERSRDEYSDLFDFAPVGYFILDKHALILNVNRTGCRLLGRENDYLTGRPFSLFIRPDREERQRFLIYLQNVIESRQLQSCEMKLQRKDQADFVARLDTLVIKNEADQYLQCRMVLNDITDEKKTEELVNLTKQLREEKEKLRRSEIHTVEAILEAQEDERGRIAAELHDGINPLLSIARLNADTIRSQLEMGNRPAQDKLENIVSLLENALREVKEITANLSPAILKEFGLVKALDYLCEKVKLSDQIEVTFLSHGISERVPLKLELNLYRIAQELLNNIINHAEATKVTVQLIRHQNSIVLTVEDNGIGFHQPFEVLITNGFGFKNISYRVKSLNGQLDVDSSPGTGTIVTVEIPI